MMEPEKAMQVRAITPSNAEHCIRGTAMAYPPPRQVRYKAARLHAQFVDGSCRRDVKRSVILVAPGEIRWLFRNHVFRASLFGCVLLCFALLLFISFCYFCEVHSQSDGASAQGIKKEN
jgi:hypothetical protein